MRKPVLIALMVGSLWSTGGIATGARALTLQTNATTTAVSGRAGASVTVGTEAESRAVTAIEWWEDQDEPCKFLTNRMDVNTGDINQPVISLTGTYTKAGKTPCNSPGNKKRVGFSGTTNFVYKVQVCTTDKKQTSDDKLKGIRIWPRSVTSTSPLTLKDGASAEEDRHTHCKDWHTAVACPAGKVASRLVVHHDAAEEKAIGLALECRTLTASHGAVPAP